MHTLVGGIRLAQTATAEKTDDQTLPHVLLVFAADLGYGDIGCSGATKLKTPHIDRLAEEGMRFTNAYVTSSTCSQSRYSLITGRLIMVHLGTTFQALFNLED
jgi:arylsulfatase A-like enzyme